MTFIDKNGLRVPGSLRLCRERRDVAEPLVSAIPPGGDPATNPTGLTLGSPLLLSPPPQAQYTPESTHPLSRAELGIPDRDLGQPETFTLHSLHALQMRPKLPGGAYKGLSPLAAPCESPGPPLGPKALLRAQADAQEVSPDISPDP